MFKRQFIKRKTEIIPPSKDPTLHEVIKNSYEKNKKKNIKGYDLDESLSNHNQQVYYNKNNNKLLYSVTGTHNLSDVGTDIMLGLGRIKNTKRYKEADETLKKAKSKYGVDKAMIASHSLGSSIGSLVGSGNDDIYSLDKGAVGQKVRNNEKNFRTQGDIVSLLSNNDSNTTNLINPHEPTGHFIKDVLNAHNVNNIKNENIHII